MIRINRRSMIAGLGAGALAHPASAQTSDASWTALAPMPAPAQEIYPTLWRRADGDKIFVAGGFTVTPNGPFVTDRAFLYDIASDTWTDGPTLPAPRHHPQLLVAAGRLWCIGGFDFDVGGPETGAWRMRANVWSYDDTAGTWIEELPLLGPRAETVGLVHADRIHLIGGRAPIGDANLAWSDHGDVAEHLVLDPAAGVWETAAPAPTARNSHAGVALGGRFYVMGGRRVDAGSNAELEVYDPASDRWDSLAPMPQAQGGLAAGVADGKIVAFGGEWFDESTAGVHPQTWIYNPARDAWEQGPDMLTPRHGLGGVSSADRIYAIGGATGPSTNGTCGMLEMLEI
jgi:N-acetylneuraminic acid mutarotase